MKSSRELIQEAKAYRFNPKIPLKLYLKTCVGILDKAQQSVQCGDTELAFMFYYRYVDLCTNKLSRHPQYLTTNVNMDSELQLYRQEYLQLMKLEVPAVIKLVEDLQIQIDRDYCKHQLSLAKNIAKPNKINIVDPLDNTIDMNHHPKIYVKDGKTSNIKYPLLPPTFNEHRFNQSLEFFSPIPTRSIDNNNNQNNSNYLIMGNTNNTSNDTYLSTSSSLLGQDNTNESNNSDPNSSSCMLHYPELPQLSFPTY